MSDDNDWRRRRADELFGRAPPLGDVLAERRDAGVQRTRPAPPLPAPPRTAPPAPRAAPPPLASRAAPPAAPIARVPRRASLAVAGGLAAALVAAGLGWFAHDALERPATSRLVVETRTMAPRVNAAPPARTTPADPLSRAYTPLENDVPLRADAPPRSDAPPRAAAPPPVVLPTTATPPAGAAPAVGVPARADAAPERDVPLRPAPRHLTKPVPAEAAEARNAARVRTPAPAARRAHLDPYIAGSSELSPPSFDGHRPRAVANPAGPRTSFNCRRAQANVTRLICRDPELARLDRDLAQTFASAAARRPRSPEVVDGEVDFLNRRGRCATAACVADVYRDRIDELRSLP